MASRIQLLRYQKQSLQTLVTRLVTSVKLTEKNLTMETMGTLTDIDETDGQFWQTLPSIQSIT